MLLWGGSRSLLFAVLGPKMEPKLKKNRRNTGRKSPGGRTRRFFAKPCFVSRLPANLRGRSSRKWQKIGQKRAEIEDKWRQPARASKIYRKCIKSWILGSDNGGQKRHPIIFFGDRKRSKKRAAKKAVPCQKDRQCGGLAGPAGRGRGGVNPSPGDPDII